MRQRDLINEYQKTYKGFGGHLLKGAHARGPRPLSSKHAIHIVMKSEMAKGALSLKHTNHRKTVDKIVASQAQKWGMKIYQYANVGNHLHILLKAHSRRRFIGFTRSISGLIARAVLKVERGSAKGIKFWQARPFTRVVKWGRDYIRAKNYVILNHKEALGFLSPRRMATLGIFYIANTS